MLERILYFLPSFLILGAITGIGLWFSALRRKLIKRLILLPGEDEQKKEILDNIIFAPALVELIFRGPLILTFSSVTGLAWSGIIMLALLSALLQYLLFSKASLERVKAELAELKEGWKKALICLADAAIFALGIVTGYLGILYQSIYVSVVIHSTWNLVFKLVLPAILYVVTIFLTYYLPDRVIDRAIARRSPKI